MIDGVTSGTGIEALERLMQFAGARHRLIANNIANLSTPDFLPQDVSVEEFQGALREALEAQRAGKGSSSDTGLPLKDTAQIEFEENSVTLHPAPAHESVLFHDGNDRSAERIMQDMVENFLVFRQASELLRNRYELLNTAIRERI